MCSGLPSMHMPMCLQISLWTTVSVVLVLKSQRNFCMLAMSNRKPLRLPLVVICGSDLALEGP